MPRVMHNPYDEPESSSLKLFGDFLLLSLLAHALLVTLLLLWNIFHPPAHKEAEKPAPTVNLSLMAPPKPIFVPTPADPNAVHKQQQVQSAHDHDLTTRSKVARNPESIMPDMNGKTHAPDMNEAPKVESPKPEVSSTPPMPRAEKPTKPTPPQPQAQPQPQPQPRPQPPKPVKPQPQVDANGLPVLPDISAPTMAQVNPALASQPLTPPVVQPQQMTSVHGALGHRGDNSPAAMSSELGKYKQYVYGVVGSYWYPDIDQHFGIIPVGTVHIQFTIHSDGRITDVIILEGDKLDQLKLISKHALIAPAPYKAFSEAMMKELGTDSYTDDFTFSVY